MGQRDLTYGIIDSLKVLLEAGEPHYISALQDRNLVSAGEKLQIPVFVGDEPKAKFPCLAIKPGAPNGAWMTLQAIDDTYPATIQACAIKRLKADVIEEYAYVLAMAVRNWLRLQTNLKLPLCPGGDITSYDSWAGEIVMGTINEGAIRAAEIQWYTKVFNPTYA